MISTRPLLVRSGMGARRRSQSALVCLTSHHRGDGIRSMLARSATAKRLGIDGMAALRFHIREQTRPCRRRRRRQEGSVPIRLSPTANLAVDEIDDEAVGETHADNHVVQSVVIVVASEAVACVLYDTYVEPLIGCGLAPVFATSLDARYELLVLSGAVEAMVDFDLNPWDAAATQCLVRAAGGRCVTRAQANGKLGLVFGSPPVVDQLVALLEP